MYSAERESECGGALQMLVADPAPQPETEPECAGDCAFDRAVPADPRNHVLVEQILGPRNQVQGPDRTNALRVVALGKVRAFRSSSNCAPE